MFNETENLLRTAEYAAEMSALKGVRILGL